MTYDQIEKEIESIMSRSRFKHSIGVAEAAARLAERYGIETRRAYLAGLIHDCAKELSTLHQLGLAMQAKEGFDLSQIPYPFVYHGPAGSVFARRKLGVREEDVLRAVSFHVLGKPEMTTLEKIIFAADYFEENRKFHWREEMEAAAYESLDLAVVKGCNITISYLESEKKKIHPGIILTRDSHSEKL